MLSFCAGGCGARVRRGRCSDCRRRDKANHGSATQRGYGYRHEKFRAWFLSRHFLCQDCEADGRTEPATDVHHIAKARPHPELRYRESNCMALCGACHNARTRRGE